MKVKELIAQLQSVDQEADVLIEQTNDAGPENISEIQDYSAEYGNIILAGDLFQ